MAADSKIMIDLELRKDQAEARLRQFEQRAAQQLERLQKMQAKYDANPTAFVRNQLNASRMAYGRRLGDVQGAGQQVKDLQMKIDREDARRGGRLFGMAVNKETESFVKKFVGAYVAREALNFGFAAMYTPGGNNSGLRKAQSTVEGAATGVQMGAAFGSFLGPWGTVIGGVVGALGGLTSAIIKDTKEIEAAQTRRRNAVADQRLDSGRNIQNEAFQQSLDMVARPAKIAKLNQRIEELKNGKGDFSIASLEAKLRKLENEEGDYESNYHQKLESMLQRSQQELTQFQSQMFRESVKPYYQFRDVGSMADSHAKQGLYTGRGSSARMIDSPVTKVQNAIYAAGGDGMKYDSKWLGKWVDYANDMKGKGKGEVGLSKFQDKIKEKYGVDVDLSKIDMTKPRQIPINGIDFKELNNPVVQELKGIRRNLDRIAGRGDLNGSDKNADGRKHASITFVAG